MSCAPPRELVADFIALGDIALLATAHAEFGGGRGLLLDPTQKLVQMRDGDLHWPLTLVRDDWPAGCVRFACADMLALSIASHAELIQHMALMIACARDFVLITGVNDAASLAWCRPPVLLDLFAVLGLVDARVLRLANNNIVIQIRLGAGKGCDDLKPAPSRRGLSSGAHLDSLTEGVVSGWLETSQGAADDEYSLQHGSRTLARIKTQPPRPDLLRSGHYAARSFILAVPSPMPSWDELSIVDSAGRELPRLDLEQHDPRGRWLSWDGERLSARIDATALQRQQIELHVDGIVFQRMDISAQTSDDAIVTVQFSFPWSPSGQREIEFALFESGIEPARIGRSWRVNHAEAAPLAGVDRWHHARRALAPVSIRAVLPQHTNLPGITSSAIIIPVYNSPHIVQRCIESVLRWTQGPASLIIVDDGSTDPLIGTMLERYAGRDHVLIHRSQHNHGYTHSVNIGLRYAVGADIVLLNSDTEVGPHWFDSLRHAAYSADDIGTVTAVSDNAGAFSVPELERACPIPEHWDLPMTQRALMQQVGLRNVSMPTGNGFCMFVKRRVFDHVGELDERAFPAGYGEENDFCQRAQRAGFRHIIAGNVLVHHERSASFGDERRIELGKLGMTVLRQRYPEYEAAVQVSLHSFERRALDYRVRCIYSGMDGRHAVFPPRPRILMVCTGADDSATRAATALCVALNERYECFLLRWDEERLGLYRQTAGALELECASTLERCNEFAQTTWHAYESCVRDWLALYAIELVHAHHLGWHSQRLPDIVCALGIPFVYTLHDFHIVCPSVDLLDNRQEFCAGRCTAGDGHCKSSYAVTADYPVLKHHYSRRWKQDRRALLAPVAVFTTASHALADVLLANHPWLTDRELHVIGDGADVSASPSSENVTELLALDYAGLYRDCWDRQASFRQVVPRRSIPLLTIAANAEVQIPELASALRYAIAAQALDVIRLSGNDPTALPAQLRLARSASAPREQEATEILVDTDFARLRTRMLALPEAAAILFAIDASVAAAPNLLICDPGNVAIRNAQAIAAFVANLALTAAA